MSTHPNAMLICVLTPDNLARKTYRDILAEADVRDDDDLQLSDDHFGGHFHHRIMEEGWNESNQISAPEGSVVFWTFLTYGYGERMDWATAQGHKDALEAWAKGICERHKCTYEISIGANYW